MSAITKTRIKTGRKDLPPPGKLKRDPKQLDKLLDKALEDSMAASDPPSVVMPEVKPRSEK